VIRTNREAEVLVRNAQGKDAARPHDTVWDLLNRFIQELQSTGSSSRHIRLILKMLHESIRADVVFWYPGATGQPVELVGQPALSAEWCQAFTRRLLAETPEVGSQLFRTDLPHSTRSPSRLPQSVVMVRISRSKSAWIVALSFDAKRRFRPGDIKILNLAKRILLSQCRHNGIRNKLKDALLDLVRCLTATIDAKDPYTCGHSERVARIASRLGRQMGLPAPMLSNLYLAGLLHDIGKIGIRDSVLQKQGELTDEEIAHIKQHPVIGDSIMLHIRQLAHLRPGVRSHHERYDGKGYPDGLAGDDIPLLARILAVADAFDAMHSARRYRPALPADRIDAVFAQHAGTQWDPRIVRHLLACRKELQPICQKGLGYSVFQAVTSTVDSGIEPSWFSIALSQ